MPTHSASSCSAGLVLGLSSQLLPLFWGIERVKYWAVVEWNSLPGNRRGIDGLFQAVETLAAIVSIAAASWDN